MLSSIPTTPRTLESYRSLIGDEEIEEIRELAEPLRGARVLHVNSTPFGGGVAEILNSFVPLMADVGFRSDWQVIRAGDDFFRVTKAMHNSLQGMLIDWTPQMWELWLQYNRANAELFDEDYDFVIIHDPQPAPLLSSLTELHGRRPAGKWVWRCHIDLTDAQVQVWDVLRPHVALYDAAVFTLRNYIKEDLRGPIPFFVPPSIDPFSAKNADIPADTVEAILRNHELDPHRPIIVQVSRFDPWKDPLGVIDVYRLVKREVPEVQLVLVASMAYDDPEGWAWYERTVRRAGEDMDIKVRTNLNGVGNVEVNAFQRAANVIIQKSVREGFGLSVTEGLWKGRPVVAGNVGGIPLQIIDGKTGYLVNTVEECAQRVLHLLRNPVEADEMGCRGREAVRRHFLTTRNLRDYLRILRTISGIGPLEREKIAAGVDRGSRRTT
ncbi:MAG: glycosyltransferase [Dehalococcoidia bacterium]|jgi:trehalose synthase